jgi:hypothetical protein
VSQSFLRAFKTHLTLVLLLHDQRDAFNGGSKADKAERGLTKEQRKAERIAAIRSSIIYSGHLLIKSGKESIFKAAWKDRYFVIASGDLPSTHVLCYPLVCHYTVLSFHFI